MMAYIGGAEVWLHSFSTSALNAGERSTSRPGEKRPGCEADLPPLRSTKVKNEWNHTSVTPHTFTTYARTSYNSDMTAFGIQV